MPATLTKSTYDEQKAKAFSESLLNTLNQSALALMISIGHRTGLFDALRGAPPMTSEEIAHKTGLNERYIREWAGALVTGNLLDYDPATKRYHLPAEHATFLTRSEPANNIGTYMQYVAVLGSVEDKVIDCFKNGGGVPYSEFPRFHEVMAEDSGQTVLPAILDQILPLMPDIPGKLTAGIDVLDSGCGRGRALIKMAQAYPNSRFYGYDLSEEAVTAARQEARHARLSNVYFEARNLTDFPTDRKFDFITSFDAIHDQARPDKVIAGIYQALKPGGVYLMQDIRASKHVENNGDRPLGPFLYAISTMHCMTVSLAQEGGLGLGTCWGEETAIDLLRAAGFQETEVRQLPHDFQNSFYISRKGQ